MRFGEGWELPPEAAPWSDFHWFSVPVGGSIQITILSDSPMWYTGHFIGGRMVPCPGAGCEGCAQGVGVQVRYAFAIADWETRRVGLIELGRNNGLMLQEWSYRNGGLRGMVVDMRKEGKHRQSRTKLTYLDQEASHWALGLDVPDVGLALFLTWDKAGFRLAPEVRERYSGSSRRSQTRRG